MSQPSCVLFTVERGERYHNEMPHLKLMRLIAQLLWQEGMGTHCNHLAVVLSCSLLQHHCRPHQFFADAMSLASRASCIGRSGPFALEHTSALWTCLLENTSANRILSPLVWPRGCKGACCTLESLCQGHPECIALLFLCEDCELLWRDCVHSVS